MPKEDNKILKYNHGEKSIIPFIIYADIESLLEKMSTCHNNPKKPSTTKISKHTASGKHTAIHCLHTVHLIQKKASLIIIETKIV